MKSKRIALIILLSLLVFFNYGYVSAIEIEQASTCEDTSTYADVISVEEAIGNEDYLDEEFYNRIKIYVDGLKKEIGTGIYCPVYCVETDTFTFPGFSPITNQGEHFTWTIGETDKQNIIDGFTVSLEGKRDCRNNIDLNQWQTDYNAIQVKIDYYESLLKKSPQYNTICMPTVGSRTCGYKVLDEYESSFSTTGMDYIDTTYSSGAIIGESEVTKSGLASEVQSNKTITVTTTQIWRYDEYGGQIFVNQQVKVLETLCPCIWMPASSVTAIPTIILGTVSKFDNEKVYSDIENNCNKGETEVKAYENGLSVEKFRCSAGFAQGSCLKTESIKHEDKWWDCECLYPWFSDELCEAEGLFQCEPQVEIWYSDQCVLYDKVANVTLIEQEYCNVNWAEYNYDGYCRTYGPYCPTGYYLGNDGSCYQRETPELEYWLGLQETMDNILTNCTEIHNTLELDTQMQVEYTHDDETLLENHNITYSREELLIKEEGEKTETTTHLVYGEGISQTTGLSCTITGPDGDCRKIIKRQVCYLSIDTESETMKKTPNLTKWCIETTKDITELWIKEYGEAYTTDYNYYLPENMYRYVLIPSGISVDSATSGSSGLFGNPFQNYIDIGYSNYPVDFNAKNGIYSLDVVYWNVGYENHFTDYMQGDNKYCLAGYYLVDGTCYRLEDAPDGTSTNTVRYACAYEIEDEKLVPDPEEPTKAIRIVYRPIDLETPFPSMSGEGRDTGSNWCDGTDCNNENETVEKYILENRGTTDLYTEKEPMYTIVLNPSTIKEIREYNSNTYYDEYDLYCEDGYKCLSAFIHSDESVLSNAYSEGCGMDSDFDYCDRVDGIIRYEVEE